MKHFTSTYRLWLLLSLFFSSNGYSQAQPDPCLSYSNHAVHEAKARKMIKNFQDTYKQNVSHYPNGRSLADSFFIDTCFLRIFKDFMSTYDRKKITGFRFVFGTAEEKSYKEILYMVPTHTKGKRQKNIWNKRLDVSGECTSGFLPPPIGERKKLLKRFKRHHRMDGWLSKPKKDSLSSSVWFESCFLNALYDSCKAKGKAGLFIYNAAYDPRETAHIPGRIYKWQSTVIIAFANREPTNALTSDFKSGQAFYDKIYQYYQSQMYQKEGQAKVKTLDDYFNHGQLCPQLCP